jgi:hypothetical protein
MMLARKALDTLYPLGNSYQNFVGKEQKAKLKVAAVQTYSELDKAQVNLDVVLRRCRSRLSI